jgi:hypothetical protein
MRGGRPSREALIAVTGWISLRSTPFKVGGSMAVRVGASAVGLAGGNLDDGEQGSRDGLR